MPEQSPELMALDVNRRSYMTIVEDAIKIAGWRMLPYKEESFAIEDLIYQPPQALVTILDDYGFVNTDFVGRELIETALLGGVPCAVITEEDARISLSAFPFKNLEAPNLFIPRTTGEIVNPLSAWLISLSHKD